MTPLQTLAIIAALGFAAWAFYYRGVRHGQEYASKLADIHERRHQRELDDLRARHQARLAALAHASYNVGVAHGRRGETPDPGLQVKPHLARFIANQRAASRKGLQ